MSLLDDLRAASANVDAQYVPSSNEVPGVLAALIAYTEHGDSFLKAAAGDDASPEATQELLSPEERDEADRQASRRATKQQTKAEHEEGKG